MNVANTTAKERILKLRRLRSAIMEKRNEIASVIAGDFGKPPVETDFTEILPVLCEIDHAIRHLPRWMKPKKTGTPLVLFGTRSHIRYEPKGIVLIIAPWNYPLTLMFNPLIAAIAAGNCAIVKTSEKLPQTSEFIVQFLNELFPEEEVAAFRGDAIDNESLFVNRYDHIFFTGSTRVGKRIMAQAAKNLTPVTLELGGKSPAIVDKHTNLEKTVERILFGKFINSGQTCVAPDYVLVHRKLHDSFIAHAKIILAKRYPVEPHDTYCRDLTRLITEEHWHRLQLMLDNSIEAGATVASGGLSNKDKRYMFPTLVINIKQDSPLMEEEIFGPILPILTFDTLEEATGIINNKEKPLALYIFSKKKKNIEYILTATQSGGTCLNTTVVHLVNAHLPFGGVGDSGIGSYHGFHGFETLSHKRAVLTQGPIDIFGIFHPPYTAKMKRRIRAIIKFIGKN